MRSIVGLRGGAGPAWLLHKLLAEFGIDRKVNGVRRAAPRRQWLPAWHAARRQQPQPQASEQPEQHQQQQPLPAHGAAAPPIGRWSASVTQSASLLIHMPATLTSVAALQRVCAHVPLDMQVDGVDDILF